MMKLFYKAGACSLSPHIVLREADLPFELESVDLGSKKTGSGGDFLNLNPKGYVPALLLDDGQILSEGPAIVQYIADLVPAKRLAPPAGSMARYRLMETLNFIATELHKGFGALFNPKAPEEWKAQVKELLGKRLAVAAAQLGGRDYLFGQDFSVADAYLFTVLSWAGYVKLDLSPWPVLKDYQARVAARPAVRAAMLAEGLIKN